MSLRYFKQRVFLKIESAFVETQVVAKHDFATIKINGGNSQANLRNLSPQKAMDNLKDLKL